MMRNTGLFLIVSALLFLAACQKIESKYVIKGEWEVSEVHLNGGKLNMMENLMPHFDEGNDCCHYMVYFDDEGNMDGYYNTYDTLNYFERGTWEWIESMTFYYYLPPYIDGTFEVEKDGNTFTMRSVRNNIEYYNIGEVEMEMIAVRTKRED